MSNFRLACVAILAALALAARGLRRRGREDSGKPKVLTTFTVVADMVRQVGGDRIEVTSITKPGAEIHGYEPTPSDLKRAALSDLVLENGMGLERWFEQFVDLADAQHVSLSEGVKPIPIAGESEYAGKPNPHAWMSVANGVIYVENIRKALTDLDPAGAATYRANAERYTARAARVGRAGQARARQPAALAPRARELRGRVLLHGARLRAHRAVPVAGQRRAGGHAEADRLGRELRPRRAACPRCSASRPSAPRPSSRSPASRARSSAACCTWTRSRKPDGPVPTYLALLQRDADTIVAGLTGGV